MKPITRNLKSTAIAQFHWLALLLAIIFTPSLAKAANGADTWLGNTSINFGDANWTGVNNPPLSGDSWLFGVAGTSGTNLNNDLTALNNVAGITFQGGASAFTLTNNSITLTGDVVNNSTSLETINFPISSTAARTFTTTTGGGNITLGGVFSGAGGGITKAGPGTLTLNGVAVNIYNGATTVTGGSLIEDFANATSAVNLIDSSSVLVLGGGALQVKQKSATVTSQTFASTTVNPGATAVIGVTNGSGALTIALGAITQNVGGTVDFTNHTTGFITTTSPNVNGILGGWATVGENVASTTTGDWACTNGLGQIVPYTGYTTISGTVTGSGAEAQNWKTAGATLNTSATINSLVEQGGSGDFIVNNGITLTLASGGLIIEGATQRWLVAGGSGSILNSGLPTGELYIHSANNVYTDYEIRPVIPDGLVPTTVFKDGPGTLSLGGYAKTYTGGTVVNGGTLQLALGGATGVIRNSLTINLGATVQCTAANAFGYTVGIETRNVYINGGTLTTTVAGDSAFNTTFNLTGGTLMSNGGTSSSAATQLWVLGQQTAANNGASGVNTFPSTITSVISGRLEMRNGNSNTNETFNVASGNTPNGIDLLVSAAITGNGVAITLAGAGTTLFSGASIFTGGVIDNNTGTLVIGNNAAFGAGGLLTMNSGSISNNTGGSFIVANNVNLASTTSVGVNTNDTLTLFGLIYNTGGLTKVGNGTLVLSGANTFTGPIIVSAGRLFFIGQPHVPVLPPMTNVITVSDGAKLGVAASDPFHLSPTTLTAGSSTGAALEFTVSSTTQAPLTPGTLTLNGVNTISVVGGNFVAGNSYPLVTYTTLAGGGSYTTGTLPNGVAGTITTIGNTITLTVTTVTNTVWTGTVNGTWDIATTANWLTNGVAGVYLDGSPVQFDDTGLNTLTITNVSGTLSPASILVNNTAKNYSIKTAIGGSGGITKSGTGWLTNSGANTYTGPTVINDGNVWAGVANQALGNNSAVSIANTATAALNLNGFATQIGSLTGGGTTGGNVIDGGATLTVGGDNTSPAAYAGVISGTGGLTKIGAGALTLTGMNNFSGAVAVAGTLNVPGALGVGTGTMTVGNAAGLNSVVNVSGLGLTNNNYNIGTVIGAVGAIYQTAGNVRATQAANGANFQIGNALGAYGYYDAVAGTLFMNELGVGGEANPSGNAIFDLNGATVTDAGWLVVCRGSSAQTAILNSYSGTLYYNNAGGGGLQCNWGAGQTTVINMMGGTVANIGAVNNSISLNQAGNVANTGILNCNGGTIQGGWVTGGANGTRVNFNGGTLAANENQTVFMTGLAAATVYSGGGTINNNGFAITIGQQFIAPTGSGVTSISSFTGGAGYIAPPIVTVVNNVSDTTGVGATAIAQINPVTGTVTNVLITCPGVNYTTTPTFTLTGGGATTPATITGAAPTANASGGLTFTGSGITALTSAAGLYTYTGTTLVVGGTLSLSPLAPSVAGLLVITNSGLLVDASSGTALPISNLTLQNNATNTFSYGTVLANPTVEAINVGVISVPGSGLMINVTALGLKPGQFTLIKYAGTPLSAGQFANFGLNPPPGVVATLSNNTVNLSVDLVITSAPKQLTWYGASSASWDFSTVNWKFGSADTIYQQYTNGSGIIAGDGVTFDDTLTNGTSSSQTNINLTGTFYPYPVTVDSTLPYSFAGVGGGITGPAYLLKNNSGSLTLLTSNSFTGGISIGGGSVIITNDSALGAVSVPVVTLADSTVLQVNGNTTNNTRAFTITGASSIGVLTNTVARFGGAVSASGGLTKIDNGTLVLAGNDNITGTLTVDQGTLNLPGSNNITGNLTVRQGTLEAPGTNNLAAVVRVADTAGLNAVLNISGGRFRANTNGGQYTSSLTVGSAAGAAGDVQLSGGTLTVAQQLGLGTGVGGYAGFNMTGGTLTNGSYIVVGFNSDMAVYNQSSGSVIITSNLMTIAAGGTAAVGVANISGGAFASVFPASSGIMVGERGEGTLNVSGSAVITVTNNAGLNFGPTASQTGWRSRINLNGGTVIANKLSKGVGTGTAILGLNGGTIQASAANATFLTGIDKVTVYPNGVTIDDGGFAITIPQPLLTPTGAGVASIAVTPGTSSGYIDTPIVTITDGAGFGSNAMATATVSGGAVTGLIITCPGNGFDPVNSSLSVAFTGGGASPIAPTIGAVTYSGNASGGLTKRGSGTLTLTGANTFNGPITNNAGTLSLKTASTNSGAVVNGGTLAVTTASIFTGSIAISNGATFTISQVGSATNSLGNLTLNGGAATPGATLGLGLTGLNPTIPLLTCGALTFNGTNTISVSGAVNLGTIPLVKYSSFPGTGTYTNITLPQGVSGYITNITANSTLYVVITSTGPGLVWTGFNTNAALTNLWNISSATNWLLGATLTTYQQPIIPGDAVTFNDSGSGVVIVNTNVGPSSMVISNNSKSYTFSGIGTISGSTGVKKLGTNIAILNLTNNSYSGDTVVSNGILQAGSASAISSSANLSVGSAGTLQLAGFSETVNGLSGSGLIDNSGTNAVILNLGNLNGAVNWSGTITNSGTGGVSFIKVGSGNSIVTGTNYLAAVAASQNNGGTMLITNGGALHLPGGAEFWVMQNAGTATVIVDGGTLDVANNWLVVGRNNAAANGTLILNSGLIQKNGGGNVVVGSLNATGNLIVNGGQLLNNANLWLGESPAAVATLHLNGGLIQASQVRENNSGGLPTVSGVAYFNGGTLQASADSGDFIQTPVVSMIESNGLILDDNGFTLSIGSAPLLMGDAFNGGLVKKGAGTVYLDAANTYTGTTLVTNGTLAGIGIIAGPVVVAPAGNLGAGDAAGVGTFTIGGNLTLQGNATLRIDNNIGLSVSNDLVSVSGSITYGGILTVTNITSDANPLVAGETFQLFSAGGSGNFTSIQGSPGAGLGYSFNPASGILSVITASVPPLSYLKITAGPVISGTSLTISATNSGAGTVYLLTTTNLATPHLPVDGWTPIWTNVLSGSGSWTTNLLNAVNPAWNMQFFELSNTNY
jgi:autotransporter-associated beta strand protein